jgi:phosphate transport system substrate-binding protein
VVLNYRTVLAIVATSTMTLIAGCGTMAARDGGTAGTLTENTSVDWPNDRLPTTPAAAKIVLKEDGSTLLASLIGKWAAAYHQQFGNVTFSVPAKPGGSSAGISEASTGQIDIGASDAFLSSGNLVQYPNMLNIPLGIAGQEITYNVRDVPASAHIQLNGQVLAAIYEGKITSWNDSQIKALNPGLNLPSEKIVLLHRAPGSGDTFLFTSYLAAQDPDWYKSYGFGSTIDWPAVPGSLVEASNGDMVDTCQTTAGCLAYIGISYSQTAAADQLGEAKLENASGNFELPIGPSMQAAVAYFISATPGNETISMINGPAKNGYPIVNYEYAIVSKKQPNAVKARDLKAFLYWAINTSTAKKFLADDDVQFQPLPVPIARLADDQIARIR